MFVISRTKRDKVLFINGLCFYMNNNKNSDTKSELEDPNADQFSDRLKLAIGDESTNAFAKKCELRESTVRGYLSGSMPSLDKAMAIARAAGVSLQWLASGEGSMRSGSTAELQVKGAIEEEFALIPGYNIQVAAGQGVFPDQEQPTRKLAFRHKWLRYKGLNEKDLVLVFAKGDSMEPTISDNNTLMIDTSQCDLSDGSIYVIRTDGHLIVKRIQKLWNKGILLLSDNKEYETQQVEPSEADDLEVIGKLVWVGKDM